MPVSQVKPQKEGGQPPQGRMTWIGLAATALFVMVVVLAVARPLIDRVDGPEQGTPQVNVPATAPAGGGSR